MSIPGSLTPLFNSGGGEGAPVLISRSLRFNSADSASLTRTFGSAGNRKTWTWSGWVKRSAFTPSSFQTLFCGGSGGTSEGSIRFNLDDTIEFYDYGPSAYNARLLTTQVFRDTSAWYHIVAVFNSASATADQRMRLYINGSEVTAFAARTNPTQNYDGYVNNSSSHVLGDAIAGASPRFFNGYLAEVHFIDGQALTPSSFAGTNTITRQWEPREYTGSYGTNGFRLNFSDNSNTTATTLGKDAAGSNNWTPNNFTVGTAAFSGSFDGNDSISVANAEPLRVRTGDFTIEFWVRFNALSGYQTLFDKGYTSVGGMVLQTSLNSGNVTVYLNQSTLFTTTGTVLTNTWYHYALVRSGTTVTMYRNGVSVGSGTSSADFSDTSTLYIGGSPAGGGYYTNGYISNFRLVKGTAVYTSSFTPPTSQLTAITNTSLLTCHRSTFIDSSINAYTVTNNGALSSTLSPFGDPAVGNDSLVDTPTSYGTDTGAGGEVRGNYCTLNPLSKGASLTLSNGNLDVTDTGSTSPAVGGTLVVSSGKWYYEMRMNSDYTYAGLSTPEALRTSTSFLGGVNGQVMWNVSSPSSSYINGSGYNYSTSSAAAVGDIIGVALNFDTGVLTFYKNGVSQGAFSTNVLSGKAWTPAFKSNTSASASFNFGQRPFAYAAPSGFKSLCDTNLPAPTIARPSTVMDVRLYTGNGSTQTISGLGFSPDLVWIKQRSGTEWHGWFDVVRGVLKPLFSNATDGEGSGSGVSSFGSNGFDVTGNVYVNGNASTYASWCWDAGSSTVTNTSGSISSQVRANASAGFSIVTYTGNGSGNATVGHGLGVAPQFIITKRRDTSNNWISWHGTFAANDYIALNLTSAKNYGGAGNNTFGGTSGSLPASLVFTVGSDLNVSSATFVAYCFAPVAGYSAFGSYTGNGSTDGPFVYTGFRPRWVMFKSSSSATDWVIEDAARSVYNVIDARLFPNTSDAEISNGNGNIDYCSNGFKLRNSHAAMNSSGATYIYAAFAENPFQYSRAR